MRRRFFVDRFENGRAVLRGDPAHHLGRVLRAEAGQRYELSDGVSLWLAQTDRVGREVVEFVLLEPLPVAESPVHIKLLLAIVKFDRFEWALEKATELAAGEIVPLAAARSEKGLVAAAGKRARRWEKILLESAQQTRCLRSPILQATTKSGEAFQQSRTGLRLLLSERPEARAMREILDTAVRNFPNDEPVQISIAIGPEGGWTDPEFSAAFSAGFNEASLGTNILRTETAVCAALASIQYAIGTGQIARVAARSPSEKEAD